jgi:hypothetical protein
VAAGGSADAEGVEEERVMAIWVQDKAEKWHEFAEGAAVQVQGDGTLTVVGAAPDNKPLGGFTGWVAWTTVEPGGGSKLWKGKGK